MDSRILELGFEKMTELLHLFCNLFQSCIPKCEMHMSNLQKMFVIDLAVEMSCGWHMDVAMEYLAS